jgi:hypothetical protein
MRYFAILFLLLLAWSCTKYPKDNFISVLTPAQRLTANPWELTQLLVNGADSTPLLLMNSTTPYRIMFSKKGRHLERFTDGYAGWGSVSTAGHHLDFTYYLDCSKGTCAYYTFIKPGASSWQILKLYGEELILSRNKDGKTYEAHFRNY